MSDVVRFARLLASRLDAGGRPTIGASMREAAELFERSNAVEGSAPWNGHPPTEHLEAPAHLLRICDGSTVAAFWVADGRYPVWETPYTREEPHKAAGAGWHYVAPLYPRDAR